jgi:hypothetical protein
VTLAEARDAIREREPIFHRPEHGIRRDDFDRMMVEDFCEIGASGKEYSRESVLDVLTERHRTPQAEDLQVSDFACRQLTEGCLYLATYTLLQPPARLTRRSTIWRYEHESGFWKIVFHQGTIVQP